MMLFGILVLITALSISAVAIYYSVAGLVAIFAAAAVPIMIMGGILEVGKLVTAVWLHKYWRKATWWLKTYLTTAVVVLMFITSMGIFGFLSKAHIEQTSASEESVAKVTQIETELGRLNAVIDRAETKIEQLESSGSGADANIQSQIDKEQERIDKAFERIQPAIDQQNKIIEDARAGDANRTKPYEDQLTNIQNEITRLEQTARDYEDKIAGLSADTSAVDPLLEQIDAIEQEIIRVTNQVNSGERDQIRAGQAIIGVTSDGAFGSNTRKALVAWVAAQRDRITKIQGDISRLRQNATNTVDEERKRLAEVVKDIRQTQIPALKERELVMLGKIDEVRQTESPVIQTARDEIQRLRKSAEEQVANSQTLIERLRSQLAQTDKADEIDALVDEQLSRIKTAEAEIDTLTEEKYALEAEYRKLEAEVGPIKYIAEFVYGDNADKSLLEEAVRWVILIIIFVFDPLAVLLLIAAQYTFEWRREGQTNDTPPSNDSDPEPRDDGQDSEDTNDETLQEDDVVDNERTRENGDEPGIPEGETVEETPRQISSPTGIDEDGNIDDIEAAQSVSQKKRLELSEESKQDREKEIQDQDNDTTWTEAKRLWKDDHPHETLKEYKEQYISGEIDSLPWTDYHSPRKYIMKDGNTQVKKETTPDLSQEDKQETYIQNSEQDTETLWSKVRDR